MKKINQFIFLLSACLFVISCAKPTNDFKNFEETNNHFIVGGETISPEDASLDGVLKVQVGNTNCSSVQINENFILTAAHCSLFSGKRLELAYVTTNKDQNDEFGKTGIWELHPSYIDLLHANDIATVKLLDEEKFSAKDNFFLPDSAELPEEIYVAGYGKNALSFTAFNTNELKRLKLSKSLQLLSEINKDTMGQDLSWETSEDIILINQSIKAGNLYCFKTLDTKNNAPFSGDSGGPLYSINKAGQKIVHGVYSIFSFTPKAGDLYFFCYETVYPKREWIQKSLQRDLKTVAASKIKIEFSGQVQSLNSMFLSGVEISQKREVKAEIVDGGLGRHEELQGLDLKGKILIIQRGEISFSNKIMNAGISESGVSGIIFYDNVEGDLFIPTLQLRKDSPSILGLIDMRFISKEDGNKIVSELKNGNKVEATLTVPGLEK
jgi:hypothetical protein